MKKIDMASSVLFSQLSSSIHDIGFIDNIPIDGVFFKKTIKSKEYWYCKTVASQNRNIYIGPCSNEEINHRVANYKAIQDSSRNIRKQNRNIVSSLKNLGFPGPDIKSGNILSAIADTGFFRLRGVLVGSYAFQTYQGILGVKLNDANMVTFDVDLAKYHSISVSIDEQIENIERKLRLVDNTFQPMGLPFNDLPPVKFRNSDGFVVEFLTPNISSDDYNGKPAKMPSLNMGAIPLRFLDFLIHNPINGIILHRSGIPVCVPSPDRYAIHKLIVAERRITDNHQFDKRNKDLMQASQIIQAYDLNQMNEELAYTWIEAYDRGPTWKEILLQSFNKIDKDISDILKNSILEIAQNDDRNDIIDCLNTSISPLKIKGL